MKVTVLFFGVTHDLTGFNLEQMEISPGENLEGLWRRYEARFPRLIPMANSLILAVNREIATRSTLLQDGDEVAFMPPVSGGAGGDFFRIARATIPVAALAAELRAPADGAVVVFEGVVRNNSRGRATLYLEYEGYEPMALGKMEEIGREVKQKFAIDSIGMIHRLGRMEIGETSVAIIVASAHRRAAFEACQYGIDRLKQIVPIWKKEYFADGAVWAEGEGGAHFVRTS
jgi:molybdopterin synthase catalytic subunit/molybdopterin converting factor small subunit